MIILSCCLARKFGQTPPVWGIYIKKYFRSTMGVGRLNGLAIIHQHRDIPINLEKIIDLIAVRQPQRMKLKDILADPCD